MLLQRGYQLCRNRQRLAVSLPLGQGDWELSDGESRNDLSHRGEDEPHQPGLNHTQPPTTALQPSSRSLGFGCVRGWNLAGRLAVIRTKVGSNKVGTTTQDTGPAASGRHKQGHLLWQCHHVQDGCIYSPYLFFPYPQKQSHKLLINKGEEKAGGKIIITKSIKPKP